MSNDQLTSENLDDETLAELIEFRRTTLKHHTDEGNKTQAVLHNMVLVALLELQERRKPQRPVAFLNDAHLNCGYVEGGVTSDDDAPGMIPVYREPVGVVYVSCLPESEFDELQERRKADSAEPIGWTDAEELRSVEKDGCGYLFKANPITPNADPRRVIKLYTTPPTPEDLLRSFDAVARLNNEMYRWTSCMSYNGSYVGEPEGLLKRNIREIEHIMDACRTAMLQGGFRDLSQPVNPQVAEYEQIMLQGGDK